MDENGGIKIELSAPKESSRKAYYKRKKNYIKKLAAKSKADPKSPLEKTVHISEETKKLFEPLTDYFFEELAAAIVYRATLDYEESLVQLYFATKQQSRTLYYNRFREVQRFLGSTWYYTLVNTDHKPVIAALNKRVLKRLKAGESEINKARKMIKYK